jgi:ribosomal protein S18 acetylase RimI-like enzyme
VFNNNIEIKKLSPLHFDAIIKLSNQQFGGGYMSIDKLKFYVLGRQKIGFVVLINQQVIGYVLFSICYDFFDIKHLILKAKEELESIFNNKYPLGIIETIVVDKKVTNKGVGSQLVSKIVNDFKNETTSIVAFLWEHPNGTPLATLLSKYHFYHQKTIPNYWLKDSKINKYECKYCGTPCHCNCLVYMGG